MSATVAVVGRGFGAAVHAPGWELAGAHVAGIAGREDWRELIRDADVVSVATPPAAHAEVALEALRLGKRVLCEKPLAATLADAEAMAAAANTPTAVNFHYRATPAFQRFRELLDVNELDVLWTTGSRLRPGPPSWKDDPAQGGALAAYGVHALDYVRLTEQPARVESASIEGDEDAFEAVLAHEHGGRTRLDISLVARERVHRVRAGWLVLENIHPSDPVRAFALRIGRGMVPLSVPRPRADPRIEPFAVHAAALLADAERPTFTDGLHAQRLLEEIRRVAS